MRFNNNLSLAFFFSVATAFRRTCTYDTTADNDVPGSYTIADNDNWSNIAADFCSNIQQLQTMNSRASMTVGQTLRVPCRTRSRDCGKIPGSGYGYYTVVDGDNLQLIARDFCADIDGLSLLNPDVKDYKITAGMVLQVPCSWN
ncbi:putative Ecp7(P20) [Drepanopeziza brunnea f. sp. 'multigermtubi' MB_m1]|uniref:Ecp6 n=2 Tax=Drepanopeziza brunnea f. sp. 'multigermtubi' TaxID=698441 RepID=D2XZ21_9HELO|nr:putative Ecp7(P20) [Drepanopeziza brunnea f. sp. 'multigermtubi' MB_m1]ADB23424.1 Ecp6 [Drepanopeziza brunnea f. sp. 'multigermtubi']AFS30723.1 LysM05p [Drepanopeziza brunnea f. sp. 'multigermtubi']EKD20391.1 putative Ecp7(P20) [Drepanopeziza brunnea f. sp. 'multigermtubi' MB_m1]